MYNNSVAPEDSLVVFVDKVFKQHKLSEKIESKKYAEIAAR